MNLEKYADVQAIRNPDEKAGRVLNKLKKIIEDRYQVSFRDYWEFHKWSIDHIPEFWAEMWDFTGIIHSKKYDKVIDLNMPLHSSQWFEGAKLNFAENLLRYRNDNTALILTGEDRDSETITYAQMFDEVSLYASAFRKLGVKQGDVVAGYMSNRKEPIYAMAAATSIGAIWTGSLPILGAQATLNRMKQVNPKILISMDRFKNHGEEVEMLNKVRIIAQEMPSLEKVIIVASKEESKLKDISDIKNSCFLDEFLELGREKDGSVPQIRFEQVSFSHPLFISYTSGTTGMPKAIVHGFGVLMTVFRDLSLHINSVQGSVWYSSSPVGWATWNMFSMLLFTGCTLVLFEGVPYYLSPTYFWDMVDEFEISHMFIPSSVLDEFEKRGCIPTPKHKLKSLEVVLAGGSAVKPQNYDFFYGKVTKDAIFSTAFGCTEFLGSSFLLESTLPLYVCEINSFCLGIEMEIVDEAGNPVVGEIGELVVTKPMPNLPLHLWGDKDGSLYREKYFSKYPGKFALSDFGIINPITNGIRICCRSDETLKQRGWRFGSSEIYNVVDKIKDIRDSICVSHYNHDHDERAVLFLKMKEGCNLDEDLVQVVQEAITNELTANHVPDLILEVQDIPYNLNGKKMEIVVKKIINNTSYNSETCHNPESLKNFMNLPELQENGA